jgi:hypothetical protein
LKYATRYGTPYKRLEEFYAPFASINDTATYGMKEIRMPRHS